MALQIETPCDDRAALALAMAWSSALLCRCFNQHSLHLSAAKSIQKKRFMTRSMPSQLLANFSRLIRRSTRTLT